MRIALISHLIEDGDVPVLELCISLGEVRREDVTNTESVTADLVRVCRTDSLEGRTDLALAHCRFVCCVEETVCRENEVGLLRDDDSLVYRNSCLRGDVVAFALECDWIENDSITHDIHGILSEDS